MKAKDVLKITGITRNHLYRLVKQEKIKAHRKPNGQYDYNSEDVYKYVGKKRRNLNIIYARVSTPKQKADLTRQIETLENFCLAQGVKIDQVFSDIASGINFEKRKQFFNLLDLVLNGQVEKVFISYKDRLSRVGFGLFKHLFLKFGTEIIVANGHANEKMDSEEIMNEIITLIHCFSMKHYSKRRVKRAIEVLNASTENKD
ncbi:transposase OrfA [Candidatus Thiomargarita nelsonii]|uniref:Transposase OrfA n=1 Tax=Candidatus Thiomargarita nelsonii TaxID=1003181 RepID=A0A176S4R1_9GAMM|nr:transposase OrfA [Candidatus Thiomargarita nelsonii]